MSVSRCPTVSCWRCSGQTAQARPPPWRCSKGSSRRPVAPSGSSARPLSRWPGVARQGRAGAAVHQPGPRAKPTARDSLSLYAPLYPHPYKVDEVLELVDLMAGAHTRVGALSGGQSRRVDLAIGIGARIQLRPHNRCNRAPGQRREHDPLTLSQRNKLGPLSTDIPGAQPEHQQHRKIVKSPRHIAKPIQRGIIDPLRVIDHDHHRSTLRPIRAQPKQPLDRGKTVRGRLPRDHPQRPCAHPRNGVKQRFTLARGGRTQQRLKQLTRNTECHPGLKLRAARPQHPKPLRGCARSHRRQQLALPNTGRTLHHDRRPDPPRLDGRTRDSRAPAHARAPPIQPRQTPTRSQARTSQRTHSNTQNHEPNPKAHKKRIDRRCRARRQQALRRDQALVPWLSRPACSTAPPNAKPAAVRQPSEPIRTRDTSEVTEARLLLPKADSKGRGERARTVPLDDEGQRRRGLSDPRDAEVRPLLVQPRGCAMVASCRN